MRDQFRFLEAAAIYEELAVQRGNDGSLFARAAGAVARQADKEQDSKKAQALYKRARALAEKADHLGTTDAITPLLLQSIRPDGTRPDAGKVQFSKQAEVDQLMKAGEAAYRQNDYAKAGECYQKAFALEPNNYMAALWSGDAYFAARDPRSACDWFRKAIALSPERETGHRYLGDALAKLGDYEGARKEWIESLLCEPYSRLTRQNFPAELRQKAAGKGRQIPKFSQGLFEIDAEKKEIHVDPNASGIGAAYALACAHWRMESFAKTFPNESKPRRSLPEEIAGLERLIDVVEAPPGKDADPKFEEEKSAWRPIVAALKELQQQGLLEAYVLLERPDAGLASDYPAYCAAHREELRFYVQRYWCGLD